MLGRHPQTTIQESNDRVDGFLAVRCGVGFGLGDSWQEQ